MKALAVADRERAIIRYLREASADGAPVRDIYERVSEELGDTVTRTAYYKILDRMEAAGTIEVLREDEERGRIYGLTDTLHAQNTLTLDDIYELLPRFDHTTDILALVVEARGYYEEHRATVIRRAAEALLEEDPVDLFYRMIVDLIEVVVKDLEILRHKNAQGQAEIADSYAQNRLESDYRNLEQVAYRGLSLPHSAIHLPGLHQVRDQGATVTYNPDALREALKRRVFGETFIREIAVSSETAEITRREIVVSGSDGSMHAGTLALKTARGYYEDVTDVITFNNSVAYVRLPQMQAEQMDREGMIHSVPFTRQTIDDPTYKGMVLAPFMFPDLTESEYQHMARSATDVVQFRVDEAIFTGNARDLVPPHNQIPKPQVHIRDGTITPQEREFGHYTRPDAYGEMVREGLRLERAILDRIISGGDRAPVFGGAVKSTQMRLFGRLLNWYISRGSRARFGRAIEPNWDTATAAHISDNEAMTALLSSLPVRNKEGKYYVTCALLRQFPSLTEFYNLDLGSEDWRGFLERKKLQALEDYQRYGGTLPYHATVDLADDDFLFLSERADYVMFYIGHTAGDPPPLLPRYEFLASLRAYTESAEPDAWRAAAKYVDRTIFRIVEALDIAGLEFDRDHNYLSRKSFRKVLPSPIQRAHEFSKSLGKNLERELKSIVVSRLIEANRLRATASESDFEVRPVKAETYLERIARAFLKSGDGADDIR